MHKLLPVVLLFISLSLLASTVSLLASPLPYSLAAKDIYLNLFYQLFGLKSESEHQWFIDDILAQTRGKVDSDGQIAYWEGQPIALHTLSAGPKITSQVLQAWVGGGEKWIEVDLSEQKLKAWEGEKLVYEVLTSTGKQWTPTPIGEFRIWIKVRKQKMSGGSRALGNYYYLPNVPHVMFFYKGYGIHGAYWHNNFGHVMSHGCINVSLPDAEKLYNWADPVVPEGQGSKKSTDENPGTRVVIHS